MSLRFAAIGIDHRHVYGMAANLIDAGAQFAGWWTEGHPNTEDGFVERFPDVPRVADAQALLDDPGIDLIVLSGIPRDRAEWAIRAMQAGKDVLSDKPGCTTRDQLDAVRACVAETGRIWSIDFSERFEVPAVTRAAELVAEGAIGRVVQTLGIGPHRLNRGTRPDWFFDREAYGGILTDIASHQIDQFLYFTGSTEAEITLATVANYANPDDPGLQDFGEIALRSPQGHGYIRVDWYTPDALPNWGDGRLTILGTDGYIELRKYVDVGLEGTDHVILVNGEVCEHTTAADAGLPFFARLIADIENRTETAMTQDHAFLVCDLALRAQAMAEARA
ncbi:Gfo/Idh/MocA family oxidoreductase [Salipiger sp. IMCC34102]|uniref:Gfo/Idh/MocA family protein n=1 Tax=Salipiger sp. IMCC34102 TaxID=2510647 RepID=UPI00101CE4B5|nr:Gfo/Idh/MocA family oxidoreductase [Salipiger sp. IMCC34102]RYH03515.1 Gfo/Idh/MocA family oxidoreductase [Salipiger sp. IMCC34102]